MNRELGELEDGLDAAERVLKPGGTLAVITADVAGLAGLPAEVHTPVSAKGLEFDVVVIVDPERIRAHNPADLYVSITRATQRLGLLHVER